MGSRICKTSTSIWAKTENEAKRSADSTWRKFCPGTWALAMSDSISIQVTTGTGSVEVSVSPNDDVHARLREEFSLPPSANVPITHGGIAIEEGSFEGNSIGEGARLTMQTEEPAVVLKFVPWRSGAYSVRNHQPFEAEVGAWTELRNTPAAARIVATTEGWRSPVRTEISVPEQSQWLCQAVTLTGEEIHDAFPFSEEFIAAASKEDQASLNHLKDFIHTVYYLKSSRDFVGCNGHASSEIRIRTLQGHCGDIPMEVFQGTTVQEIKERINDR